MGAMVRDTKGSSEPARIGVAMKGRNSRRQSARERERERKREREREGASLE